MKTIYLIFPARAAEKNIKAANFVDVAWDVDEAHELARRYAHEYGKSMAVYSARHMYNVVTVDGRVEKVEDIVEDETLIETVNENDL